MTVARHVAVVLAAGASARLGQPKQLLTRDGETLLHRAVRLAVESGAAKTFVVLGAQAERLADALQSLPCEIVHNAAWQHGMASSLRAVAPAVAAEATPVLVLACDQPALELPHLQQLLEGASRAPAGVAATLHEGLAGVPAVVPAAWFADVPDEGERGFGPALRALSDAREYRMDAPELHLDIDTADDLATARARGLIDP